MAVNLSPVGGVAAQFFTNTGAVLTGGKLYTYAAGTTTPAVAYTSSGGSTAWTNPIVLDAAGRVSGSGEIWLTDGIIYKFVLKDSNDVLIATYDNITGINSNSVAYSNQQEIVTATAGQTVFNLSISYQPGTNSLSVFVDGVNQYGPGAQYAYTETDSDTVTFVSGLHVGAEVKFTTTQQQGAGAVDSSQVTYDPPFTDSVATNVEAKLAQYVSVMDFGAVGDGTTDDTAAIEAALAAASGIYFPAGTYKTTSTISVGSNKNLFGESRAAIIDAYGCDMFDLPANTSNTRFSTLTLRSFSSGGTPNPNLYDAIYSHGISGTTNYNITCQDLFLLGWGECIRYAYTLSSVIDNIATLNCQQSVVLFGQSVNNYISNSTLTANSGVASVRTIKDGATQGEGLTITNCLLSSGLYGLQSDGFLSIGVLNCVVDLIQDIGFNLTNAKVFNLSGCWVYATNAGVKFNNLGTVSEQQSQIVGNRIEVTAVSSEGVRVGGANTGVNIAANTFVTPGSCQVIYVDGDYVTVTGNRFVNTGSTASIFFNCQNCSAIGNIGDNVYPVYFASNKTSTNDCPAWVRFVGSTGVVTKAYNCSVARNGTGDYTLTFDEKLSDANYAVQVFGNRDSNNSLGFLVSSITATSVNLTVKNQAGTAVDPTIVCVNFFD